MMTRQEVEDFIVQTVTDRQGCKIGEIIPDLVKLDYEGDVVELLYFLISEGTIVEIRYTVPNMDYRIKSFLLPKNSTVSVDTKGIRKSPYDTSNV